MQTWQSPTKCVTSYKGLICKHFTIDYYILNVQNPLCSAAIYYLSWLALYWRPDDNTVLILELVAHHFMESNCLHFFDDINT